MGGWGELGRVGPPITGLLFVNWANSCLPDQKNEKHRHRQQEETSSSIKVNKSRYKHCGVTTHF